MAGQTKGYAHACGANPFPFGRRTGYPADPPAPHAGVVFQLRRDTGLSRRPPCRRGARHPGFGQSFRPDGSPSTEDYGRWLLEALDALGIGTFHLAAHHTGTHFAAEMARLAPERAQSLTLSGVLYAPEEDRAKMRADIGNAAPIARDGSHVSDCWDLMKSLFLDYDGPLVHAETLGALTAMEARDQAFDAIFAQDFGAVFREVRCPVQIVQAADDPLTLGECWRGSAKTSPPCPSIRPARPSSPRRNARRASSLAQFSTSSSLLTQRTRPWQTSATH
ncbi:alpha/beta fold hydrolase [Novosphingobium resinovorum]